MKLLASLYLCLCGATCGAATYYVATNGQDANPGTSASPVASLQRGVNLANAGDVVVVQPGTYGNNGAVTGGDGSSNEAAAVTLTHSGTSSAPITIQAASSGSVTLDCMMLCDAYIDLKNSSYVVIQNFIITRGFKEGIHSNDAAHHITLRGNTIQFIGNRNTATTIGIGGMYTNPLCHDFVIDGNSFHDIGRTNVGQLDHGLYLHGTNMSVTNNTFYNIIHGFGIQTADGLTNITISNNSFTNVGPSQGQVMLWNSNTGLTISNNTFNLPSIYAITRYASTVSSCTISGNTVTGSASLISDPTGCTIVVVYACPISGTMAGTLSSGAFTATFQGTTTQNKPCQ